MTRPIRAAEPDVISTNHGSAIAAISLPVVEISSAANSAVSGRRTDRGGAGAAVSASWDTAAGV